MGGGVTLANNWKYAVLARPYLLAPLRCHADNLYGSSCDKTSVADGAREHRLPDTAANVAGLHRCRAYYSHSFGSNIGELNEAWSSRQSEVGACWCWLRHLQPHRQGHLPRASATA